MSAARRTNLRVRSRAAEGSQRRWPRLPRWVIGVAAVVPVASILALQAAAIHGQSLTGDGAYHLLAGYQALRYGTNAVNLEHPPLVKLVAALPALAEGKPLLPPISVDSALAWVEGIHRQPELLWRSTVRGRYLVLLCFGLPLFAACFSLGRRFGGRWAGWSLLVLFGLSLSVIPYVTIFQTDAAVALGFLLTLIAGMRWLEEPGAARAAALGLVLGLTLATKYSGLLLLPVVAVVFTLPPSRRVPWARRVAGLATALAVGGAVVLATFTVANWGYSPERGRRAIELYCRGQGTLVVADLLLPYEDDLLALERLSPAAAQFSLGLLGVRVQNSIGVYPSFAFGRVTSKGRWWYFPAVFLVKTPIVILLAALLVVVSWRLRREVAARLREQWRATTLLAVAAGVYLTVAVFSSYNIGIRHLLPVLPILYLPVALAMGRERTGRLVVAGLLVLEATALAPLWLSATNTWWLGERNPTRFALGTGNTEYRQNLRVLARFAEERGIERLGLVYPGVGDAVVRAYLPGSRSVEPGERVRPGWYAVNVIVEQLVPAILQASPAQLYYYEQRQELARGWLALWQEVQRGEDQGYAAATFHLYYLPGNEGEGR